MHGAMFTRGPQELMNTAIFIGGSNVAAGEALLQRVTTTAPAGLGANPETKAEKIRIAKQKGYEGDMCHRCFNFTLVRSGACTKCDTCGETSGCG